MVRVVRPGVEQQGRSEVLSGPGRLSSTPQAQYKVKDKNHERPSPLYFGTGSLVTWLAQLRSQG